MPLPTRALVATISAPPSGPELYMEIWLETDTAGKQTFVSCDARGRRIGGIAARFFRRIVLEDEEKEGMRPRGAATDTDLIQALCEYCGLPGSIASPLKEMVISPSVDGC